MQLPALLYPDPLLRLLLGIVFGGFGAVVFGFASGWWVTPGGASRMAQEQSRDAVIAVLAPICAENFRASKNATAQLIELNQFTVIWDRGPFIEKGGWATMPGAVEADRDVARECANILGRAAAAERSKEDALR